MFMSLEEHNQYITRYEIQPLKCFQWYEDYFICLLWKTQARGQTFWVKGRNLFGGPVVQINNTMYTYIPMEYELVNLETIEDIGDYKQHWIIVIIGRGLCDNDVFFRTAPKRGILLLSFEELIFICMMHPNSYDK